MAVDGHEYVPLATSPASPQDEQQDTSRRHHHRHRRRGLLGLPLPTFLKPRHILYTLPPILCFLTLGILHLHPSSPFSRQRNQKPLPADNPYFFTGDVWEHNDDIAAKLERCSSLGLLRDTSLPVPPLAPDEEADLMAQGCGTNETTVIVLASLWFAEAFAGTSTAGETIYAQSVISTLNAYSYSYVFSSLGWWNADMRKTVELWRRFRGNVRMVLADPEQVDVCWKMTDQECLKTKENEQGIEAWRLLSFWYWDDPGNPLGPKFTLSPSPLNPNHFLSYSIEPTCRRLPFVPPDARASPPQAYLLAKQVHYLDATPDFAWTIPFLAQLQSDLGIKVVGGMTDDDTETRERVENAGLTNLGRLGKIEFYEELARSFVFVGVGRPRISPSPWDALCMGVPFINPIKSWDEEDPDDRSKWHAQQWHMTDLEPPYVYQVKAQDLTALKAAVVQALHNPIDSYIPDYMRFEYVCERMAQVVEGDWRSVGAGVLEERLERGEEGFDL